MDRDLYTGLILSAEQKAFYSELENQRLRLALMKANELLELRQDNPKEKTSEPESKSAKLIYRNNASKATVGSPEFRQDFTYGGRAVFDEEMLNAQRKDQDANIKFSITVDATGSDYRLLLEMLTSIYEQTYKNYELCVTDNSDKKHFHISKILKNAEGQFGGRLKINTQPSGDFVVAMKPEDLLHPSALYLMAKKITEETDTVYADVAGFEEYPQNVTEGYPIHGPFDGVRPPVAAIAVRLDQAGSASGEERSHIHIPVVLRYSRGARLYYELPKKRSEVKGNPLVSILICNKDHKDILERCISSIEEKTTWDNYEIIVCENNSTEEDIREYYKKIEADPKVTVITWDGGSEFNYSALNNFAAKNSKGEYLILLNNDTEVIEEGWIEALLESAQKDDAGASGCLLVYPDDTIQHAGMCISGGDVFHIGMHESGTVPGFLGAYARPREAASVTAACMMVRRSVWDKLGGLDEEFKVAFNDVDFCLRAREAGYKIEYTPYAKLYHHEGKSRGFRRTEEKDIAEETAERNLFIRRHPVTALYDPYYSLNFLPDGHYIEKLPTSEEKQIAKAVMRYSDIPFLIDSRYSAIARQALYVSTVILGKTDDIRFTYEDAEEGSYIFFTDASDLDSCAKGYIFIAKIGNTAVLGKDIDAGNIGEFTWENGRLIATGFHAVEGNSSWSSEAVSEILLPGLKKEGYQFTILQGAQIPLEPLGIKEFVLNIKVGDDYQTSIAITEETNGKDLTFDVPADAISDGITKVAITTTPWSPSDYGAPDSRKLGFSCRGIKAESKNVL